MPLLGSNTSQNCDIYFGRHVKPKSVPTLSGREDFTSNLRLDKKPHLNCYYFYLPLNRFHQITFKIIVYYVFLDFKTLLLDQMEIKNNVFFAAANV